MTGRWIAATWSVAPSLHQAEGRGRVSCPTSPLKWAGQAEEDSRSVGFLPGRVSRCCWVVGCQCATGSKGPGLGGQGQPRRGRVQPYIKWINLYPRGGLQQAQCFQPSHYCSSVHRQPVTEQYVWAGLHMTLSPCVSCKSCSKSC